MRPFRMLKNRNYEWPIVRIWYTKKKGMLIEDIIDTDPDFFMWMVETFQNVTPMQAKYFLSKTGQNVPLEFIQDVEPYDWQKDDDVDLYMELCETQDLTNTLKKYRTKQLNLFD